MIIRKVKMSDMDEILRIYGNAREFMSKTGNPTQWGDGYPHRPLLESDIEKQQLYLCESNGQPHAVFMFAKGEDPTYKVIDGTWLNNRPYAVIHRIASDGTQRGVLPFCTDYCKSLCGELRIDTHADNKVMQHLLEKHGFCRCGIIRLENGDPRIAYHYSANGEENAATT